MPRCIPDPNRPGYDRCGQRSATTKQEGPICYYCGLALRAHLDREAQKRRRYDDDPGMSPYAAQVMGLRACDD